VPSSLFFAKPEVERVARRDTLDPFSDRAVLFPTAHTPRKGTYLYSNHWIVGNQLSAALHDDFTLTATALFGSGELDSYYGVSGKLTEVETEELTVSYVGQLLYRGGHAELDSQALAVGVSALVDCPLTPNLILSGGVHGFTTAWYGYDELDSSSCSTRSDFLAGDCFVESTRSEWMPLGGHAIALNVSALYWPADWLSLRAELFSGASRGTFLGTEWAFQAETRAEERARYTDGETEAGIPFDRPLGLSLGATFSSGAYALAVANYFLVDPTDGSDPDEAGIDVAPMLSLGARF
jgi:hypothetical protein